VRATYSIAFICSGNRFRSPLASALVQRLTIGHPFEVGSFGTLELGAQPPLDEAREIGLAYGVDLSQHRTRCLTADSLAEIDLVLGFEQEHVRHAVVDAGARQKSTFTLPEIVSLLGEVRIPEDEDVVARARAAIWEVSAYRDAQGRLRDPDSIPDPFGHGWRVYMETAMRIRDLCVELARGLVGDAQTQELATHPAVFQKRRPLRRRAPRPHSSLG
jgi:protein-tyrosine-phosphatase